MLKIIGKAHYSVTYEGKVYPKIRYTLEVDSFPSSYKDIDGVITDTVCVKDSEFNNKPNVGDVVQVCYNKYGKPDALIII